MARRWTKGLAEAKTPDKEANAYLRTVLAEGTLPAVAPATPLEEAQEVVYQALEARGKRRVELARKALTISPDCADAYVLLAEAAEDAQEARCLYEQEVQAGERALGAVTVTEEVGPFWGTDQSDLQRHARERHAARSAANGAGHV